MSLRTGTHTHYEKTLEDVTAELSKLGFVFSAPEKVTHTLLDTFDGRLNDEGLKLDLRKSIDTLLTLRSVKAAPLILNASDAPRSWHDLQPGKMRKRVAKITDIRALLPQATILATETRAHWRNADGDIVATATLFQNLSVAGQKKLELPPWLLEIETDEHFPAYANEVRSLVRRTKLEHLKEDALALSARAASINLGGFKSSTDVPLDPYAPALDGFRAVLLNLSEAITINLPGVIERIDPVFLHEFRVAIRRTRAVLRQGRSVLPSDICELARERFAWLSTITGDARDFDVFLIEWDDYTRTLSVDVATALEPMRAYIEDKRNKAYAELVPKLKSRETKDFLSLWRTWLRNPLQNDQPNDNEELGNVVSKRIARTQSLLLKKGRVITPETPCEQVHDLRKDAKKVRYLLECFGNLLPSDKQRAFVRRLKAFQDILGEHQDAAVHVEELRELARELQTKDVPVETVLAIGQLIEQLDQRRKAAREAFAKGFTSYDSKENRQVLNNMLEQIM